MNELSRAVRADLAEACAHLLDQGLAPVSQSSGQVAGGGPVGQALKLTEAWWRILPAALNEIEQANSGLSEEIVFTRIPRGARPSRQPYDYGRAGNTLVPLMWRASVPLVEPALPPLAWLLNGLDELYEELAQAAAREEAAIDEATTFRMGSEWGAQELEQLKARSQELQSALQRCSQMRRSIRASAHVGLVPTKKPPAPFPQGRPWQHLRRLIRGLSEPAARLPGLVQDLLGDEEHAVDLPYLYQRWCTLKMLQALESLGWKPTKDPIPALLLSGSIELRCASSSAWLLCEPRLVRGKPPIRGLSVEHGEATPDLVLIMPGSLHPCVYVLDPTLATNAQRLRKKRKYLDLIKIGTTHRVAGAKVLMGPARSWAAAPIAGSSALLDDWNGMHGILPMNPCRPVDAPLRAWLEDFLAQGSPRA